MTMLVGDTRIKAVDFIVNTFSKVREGDSQVITVEAPMGYGKTRIVQEVYSRLSSDFQSAPKYWPKYLSGNEPVSGELGRRLETRGLLAPRETNASTEALMEWIWWGLSCRQDEAGAKWSALGAAQNQLLQHVDRLSVKPVRRKRDIIFGVADLALKGIKASNSPLVEALDAAQGLASLLHEYSSPAGVAQQLESKTEEERKAELAKGISGQLKLISSKAYRNTVPVIVVVDDAHWAGADELMLLRELASDSDARILIVATVWPEVGISDFSRFINELQANQPDRLHRITLERLNDDDIAGLVLEAAPKTEANAVKELVAISWGNPLILNCILDLPIIKSDVNADGRIDTSPKEFRRMPPALRQHYQKIWKSLLEPERELLAILAIQGEYFLADYPMKAAEGLGRYECIKTAFESLCKTNAWIGQEGSHLYRFSEGQRLEVAEDNISSVLSEDERVICQTAALECFKGVCTGPAWQEVGPSEKITILGLYLQMLDGASEENREEERIQLVLAELIRIEREEGDLSRVRELEAEYALSGIQEIGVEGAGHGASVSGDVVESESSDEIGAVDAVSCAVSPYLHWQQRQLADLREASIGDIEDILVEIVEIEGPITLGRLFRTVIKNSPCILSQRVRDSLNAAIRRATRKKVFVNRVGWGSADTRFIRLSSQPEIRLRENGGRSLEEYPCSELMVLVRRVIRENQNVDPEQQKRLLLKETTEGFLTEKVSKFLDPIFRKCRDQSSG